MKKLTCTKLIAGGRGGGSKNRSLGQTQGLFIFRGKAPIYNSTLSIFDFKNGGLILIFYRNTFHVNNCVCPLFNNWLLSNFYQSQKNKYFYQNYRKLPWALNIWDSREIYKVSFVEFTLYASVHSEIFLQLERNV